ncbi:MAG: DUF3299 domain-containing protein [Candidatus Hydrogenedentes bacterium]|nr:DUF3299 domain-containing protein [Candidatus Hydrogenedentota bacterium]
MKHRLLRVTYTFAACALFMSLVTVSAQDENKELRGKPLQGAPLTPQETTGDGATEDPLALDQKQYDEYGQPIRAIPQSSFDLLEKEGGAIGLNSDDLDFKKTKDGKYFKVSFNQLGIYTYEVPDPDAVAKAADPRTVLGDQIPKEIKALHQQDVLIIGFMVPIEINEKGLLTAFALTQNQAFCCYGVPPAVNEWLMVEMAEGAHADFISDMPIAVYGKMDVGEELDEGYILSVYRMKATEVIQLSELVKRIKAQEESK